MRGRRWLEPALTAIGERLGLSAGQAYTVLTGLAVAVGLLGVGLPPVLRHQVTAPIEQAASTPPRADDVDAAPSPEAPISEVQVPAPGSFSFADPSPVLDRAEPPPLVTRPSVPTGPTPGASARFAAVPNPGAPAGVAVGPDGTVYVATGNALTRGGAGPGVVAAFDPAGKLLRTWPVEGMADTRSVGLTDLVVDAYGAVWVLDASTSRVLRLDAGSAAPKVVATVPDVPACAFGLRPPPCEPGFADGAPELRGLTVRPAGGVFVADRVQGVIWSVDELGKVAPVAGYDDRIAGEGPVDLTVMGDGSLVATISARLSSVPSGAPAVVRFPVSGNGFGAPTVVTDLAAGDAPQAVVPTASGRVYVALSGVNEVVDIGLEQGDVVRHGAGLDPAFDVPTGLALRDGSLLVTNQGDANADASRWLVIAFGVADRPPSLRTRSTS